jgi:cytochrome c oxidase cbb3-type subunit 2
MSKFPRLFFGVLIVFGSSWLGIVAYAYVSLADLQPETSEETGGLVPPPWPGTAELGQHVYAVNGCVYCHSQQVRPAPLFTDIARGLGVRQTVPRDYLRTTMPFLGDSRIGSDLSNIGLKHDNAAWFYQLLYEPTVVMPGSNMPAYRYLFEEREISGQRSQLAVNVTGPQQPKPGYEIIPKADAIDLVGYLMSLKRDYPLPEAPAPAPEE